MNCEGSCAKPAGFPIPAWNRPGLSDLRYRIGSYPSIREYLLDLLDKDPDLQGWTHRGADDPGIALLEGAALVGDVLTFYQELYANEVFLRTAKWKESVADLVRLLGYRLAPGLGGNARFALTVKEDVPRPPGSKPLPVVVPAGFPLKAHLEDREQPDDFETAAELQAYPHLSRFRLYRPPLAPIKVGTGTRRDRLEIRKVNGSTSPDEAAKADIKSGDRLMLVPDSSMFDTAGTAYKVQEKIEILVVEEVETVLDRIVLTFKTPLRVARNATSIRAYRIDRNFGHFGAAAPPTTVVVDDATQEARQYATDFVRDIWGTHQRAQPTSLYPALPAEELPLDGKVDGLTVGSVLIATGLVTFDGRSTPQPFTVVKTVQGLRADNLSWGNLTGPATVATVESRLIANGSILNEKADIRNLLFHEATSPELELAATRTYADSAFTEPKLLYFGYASEIEPLEGRQLLLEHEDGRTQEVGVISVTATTFPAAPFLAPIPAMLQAPAAQVIADTAFGISQAIASGIAPASVQASTPTPSPGPAPATASIVQATPAVFQAAHFLAPAKLTLTSTLFSPQVLSYILFQQSHPRLWTLTLDQKPAFLRKDFDELENRVWVYGNLADATQGKTEAEAVLGDGDGRADFQTFALPKPDLTFLLDPGRTPAERPELEVRVDGLLWTQVDTLFNAGPEDKVYIVRQEGEDAFIQFGDGRTGARATSGKGNVTARFRTGTGAGGPLQAGKTPQAGGRLSGLDKVFLPLPVTGGAAPEAADRAREAAPGRMQSLGRMVSLADYEAECLALPGVVKVRASWGLVDGAPALTLAVLTASEDPADLAAITETMNAFNRCRGPARFHLEVIQGRRRWTHFKLTVGLHPAYREDDVAKGIQAALGAAGAEGAGVDGSEGLFGEDRAFGGTAHVTQVLAAAQNVPGVVWVQALASQVLPAGNPPEPDPLELPLPSNPPRHENLNCGSEEILALHVSHLVLAFTATQVEGECGA
jgi:predicted phage baseplate assembly protein